MNFARIGPPSPFSSSLNLRRNILRPGLETTNFLFSRASKGSKKTAGTRLRRQVCIAFEAVKRNLKSPELRYGNGLHEEVECEIESRIAECAARGRRGFEQYAEIAVKNRKINRAALVAKMTKT